jgi:predicted 2-oxoglutarate/Fe(II)-dependent dioxygenase YbiX
VATDLVPSQPGFILVVPGFFTLHECAMLREAMEAAGLNTATHADTHPRKNEAYLDRESLTFRDEIVERVVYERLAPLAPAVEGRTFVGFSTKWRYYIYRKGQRFDQHVDVSTKGANPGEETEYTLLVYLNGEGDEGGPVGGGETIFWATAKKELCQVAPRAGMLLLHAHGRR